MNETTTQLIDTAQNGRPSTRRQLSTQQIMALKEHDYEWRCDKCKHAIPTRLDQIEAVPWLIVRHLLGVHGMTVGDLVEDEPCLTREVRTYCADMRIR